MKLFLSLFNEPRSWIIILSNLYIFYGIYALDWSIFIVMALFWAENIIIGVFNMFKLMSYPKPMTLMHDGSSPVPYRIMIGIIWFAFLLGFCHVHAIFIHSLFAEGPEKLWPDGLYLLEKMVQSPEMMYALAAISGSYAYDFIYRYLYKNEREDTHILALTMGPFFKVAVLHLTIIFGGMVIGFFGAPMVAVIILVVLKILVELVTHKLSNTMQEKMNEIKNQKTTLKD